jgi:hypothetical protein
MKPPSRGTEVLGKGTRSMKPVNNTEQTSHPLWKFHRLSGRRKGLLFEAVLRLPAAWLTVRGIPFRWWSFRLGTSVPGEADPPCGAYDSRAAEVAWAVNAINRRAGGRFTCLMLAMTAQRMLALRGISSSLILGTTNELNEDEQRVFKAHAWLRVGGQTVLGQHGGRFTAITSFVKLAGENGRRR